MGTRSLTLAKSKDKYKIAQYGQFDGYPDGHGLIVLSTIRDNFDFDVFRERLDKLVEYSTEEVAARWREFTKDEDGFVSLDESKSFSSKYPYLTREFAGKIIQAVYDGSAPGVCVNLDFAANSCFCEWAYVVDLDLNTFEVYRGFNRKPLGPDDRFYFLSPDESDKTVFDDPVGFYPIKIVASWPLDELPADDVFLDTLNALDKIPA